MRKYSVYIIVNISTSIHVKCIIKQTLGSLLVALSIYLVSECF